MLELASFILLTLVKGFTERIFDISLYHLEIREYCKKKKITMFLEIKCCMKIRQMINEQASL